MKRPHDDKGCFVPLTCPRSNCGYGKIVYEGNGDWRCDGLADPNDDNKDLEACGYFHSDGEPQEGKSHE